MMGSYDCGMMGGLSSFGWPMGGLSAFGWVGLLIEILFWGGLLAFIAWAIARIFPIWHRSGEHSEGHAETAAEILRQRFARGEIDDNQAWPDSCLSTRGLHPFGL